MDIGFKEFQKNNYKNLESMNISENYELNRDMNNGSTKNCY